MRPVDEVTKVCVIKSNWIGFLFVWLWFIFVYFKRGQMQKNCIISTLQTTSLFLVKIRSTLQWNGIFQVSVIVRRSIAIDGLKVVMRHVCTIAKSTPKTICYAMYAIHWFQWRLRIIWSIIFNGNIRMNQYQCPIHQRPLKYHNHPFVRIKLMNRMSKQYNIIQNRANSLLRKTFPGVVKLWENPKPSRFQL